MTSTVAITDDPRVTVVETNNHWTRRRYLVDGVEVATVRQPEGHVFACSPQHRSEWRGVQEWPIGEHLEGCGFKAVRATWAVYPTRIHQVGGRFLRTEKDAFAEAERIVRMYLA